MKKLIITTLAIAFGVCVYAKTLDELVAEMPTGTTTKAELDARAEYMEANKDDFIRELKNYSVSEIATKSFSALTDAEKKIRRSLAPAYFEYGKSLGIAEIVGVKISTTLYWLIYGDEGYNRIKSAGWIVDGVKINNAEIRSLAFFAKDFDTIASMDVSGLSKTALLANASKIKKLLLNATDTTKAKEYCRAYQRAMLARGVSDSCDAFKELKAVEDYLNRGLLFK